MDEQEKTTTEEAKEVEVAPAKKEASTDEASPAAKAEKAAEKLAASLSKKRAAGNARVGTRTRTGGKSRRSGGRRGGRSPRERSAPEFAERVVDIRRVTRVMAGGKRFRFRTTIIIGDQKGRVGVGMGKGADVVTSINKAKNDAKKNMFTIVREKSTIPHEVSAKFSAAKVLLKPAKEGSGLVAGGTVRVVLELAGISDITAKCLGKTTNKVTNAMATIEALKKLRSKDARIMSFGKKKAAKKEAAEVTS